MKTLAIFIFISLSFNSYSQAKFELKESDKKIILLAGCATSFYGIFREGCTKENKVLAASGVLFAVLPYLIEIPKGIKVNSSGINISLKYKRFKCVKSPYNKF